jgi:hypothetical protein
MCITLPDRRFQISYFLYAIRRLSGRRRASLPFSGDGKSCFALAFTQVDQLIDYIKAHPKNPM